MKKGNLIIWVILILVVGTILLIIRGSEDTWFCRNGEWVKHGNPSAEKPTQFCEVDGEKSSVSDFNSCVEAGNAIMESYPRQCRDSENEKTFTENLGNKLEAQDLIELTSVQPNDKISSPLILEGQAVGGWYFEGDFPVILTNWDGLIIAEDYVTAQGDWMTEKFVPFKATLEFTKPEYNNRGFLILKKDNPSGLSEHDNALEIPILFE